MLNQRVKENAYLEALLDGLLLCLAFVLAFSIRSLLPLRFLGPHRIPGFSAHFWLLSLGVPLFWALASVSGLYERRAKPYGVLLLAVLRPFLYLTLLLGTAIFFFQSKTFSRAVFLLFLVIAFGLVAGVRVLLKALAPWTGRSEDLRRRVLIVGTGREALEARLKIQDQPEHAMDTIGHLACAGEQAPEVGAEHVLGDVSELKRIVEQQVVDDVIFAVPLSRLRACERPIAWCEEVGVTTHVRMDLINTRFARVYPSELDGTPMITISATPRDPVALVVKRFLDVVVSLTALVALSPVLLVSALAVRLSSHGPVLFRQGRVGLNGRPFTLYKFRSMYRDAELRKKEVESLNEVTGPVFKMKRDPRVTPVGRWLRKFSLDELPQIWNVLRGDMSLVGPRPPIPEEVRRYERWQRRRLSMKPGITCLWQVSGRSRIAFDEWMKLDLAYIDNWSLKLDLKILLRTVPAVVLARGAE